jgi:hypothetical protein
LNCKFNGVQSGIANAAQPQGVKVAGSLEVAPSRAKEGGIANADQRLRTLFAEVESGGATWSRAPTCIKKACRRFPAGF